MTLCPNCDTDDIEVSQDADPFGNVIYRCRDCGEDWIA